jgi:hypothetical protein
MHGFKSEAGGHLVHAWVPILVTILECTISSARPVIAEDMCRENLVFQICGGLGVLTRELRIAPYPPYTATPGYSTEINGHCTAYP